MYINSLFNRYLLWTHQQMNHSQKVPSWPTEMPSNPQGHAVQYVMSVGDITINHFHHESGSPCATSVFPQMANFWACSVEKTRAKWRQVPQEATPDSQDICKTTTVTTSPAARWPGSPERQCQARPAAAPPPSSHSHGDPSTQQATALLRDPHCQLLC